MSEIPQSIRDSYMEELQTAFSSLAKGGDATGFTIEYQDLQNPAIAFNLHSIITTSDHLSDVFQGVAKVFGVVNPDQYDNLLAKLEVVLTEAMLSGDGKGSMGTYKEWEGEGPSSERN